MKSKLFIAMVAIATLSFVSCEKNEVSSEKVEPSKIAAIEEKITDNEVKPADGSILKSSSNTWTYNTSSFCTTYVLVNIPANADKTVKIEIYENTGIGGTLTIQSWPNSNISTNGVIPRIGYKTVWTVSRSSLGSDNQFKITLVPTACGYATGKIVLLTY